MSGHKMSARYLSIHNRIVGIAGDAALVVEVASHLDVSIFAPSGTIRVFHKPIIHAASKVLTIADEQNLPTHKTHVKCGLHLSNVIRNMVSLTI